MDAKKYKAYWPKPSSYHLDTVKIKRLMDEKKLTEQEIAAKLKTTQPTIHRTITNETRNERVQRAIARVLRVPFADICLYNRPTGQSQQPAAA